YKLLAGGGMLKIVNQTVKPALEKLGYNSEEIERIIAHIDAFDTIEDVIDNDGSTILSGLKPEHLSIFDCAFKPFKGERSLNYMAHLRIMAAAQPFLSGAISSLRKSWQRCAADSINRFGIVCRTRALRSPTDSRSPGMKVTSQSVCTKTVSPVSSSLRCRRREARSVG